MPRLTKTPLDGLTPGNTDVTVWDSLLTGFGVRLRPGGSSPLPHQIMC